jgi:hypothetical protein
LNGFEELEEKEPMILEYKEELFSQSSREFSRALSSIPDLESLQKRLDELIEIISPYFMHHSSHKILEYLIHNYEIHIYSKDALIFSLLPFMQTNIFLRMLQLININNDPIFGFLLPFAKQGVQINRKAFIQQIIKNPSLFNKITEFILKFCERYESTDWQNQFHSYINFYGVIVLEALKQLNQETVSKIESTHSDFIQGIIYGVSEGIKFTQIGEWISTLLLIIMELSTMKLMSDQYTNAILSVTAELLNSLPINTYTKQLQVKIIQCIAIIATKQRVISFEEDVLKILLQKKYSQICLNLMRNFNLHQFIRALFCGFTDLLKHEDEIIKNVEWFLQQININQYNLNEENIIFAILHGILHNVIQNTDQGNEESVISCLKLLQKHHAFAFVKSIDKFIQKLSGTGKENVVKCLSKLDSFDLHFFNDSLAKTQAKNSFFRKEKKNSAISLLIGLEDESIAIEIECIKKINDLANEDDERYSADKKLFQLSFLNKFYSNHEEFIINSIIMQSNISKIVLPIKLIPALYKFFNRNLLLSQYTM